ncbi:hypothetical protein AAY473_002354 [Plecturocebus cupreus]
MAARGRRRGRTLAATDARSVSRRRTPRALSAQAAWSAPEGRGWARELWEGHQCLHGKQQGLSPRQRSPRGRGRSLQSRRSSSRFGGGAGVKPLCWEQPSLLWLCPPGRPVCGPHASPSSLARDWAPPCCRPLATWGPVGLSAWGQSQVPVPTPGLCFQNTPEGPGVPMGPLCPPWLSGLEKAPRPPLEPCSRADRRVPPPHPRGPRPSPSPRPPGPSLPTRGQAVSCCPQMGPSGLAWLPPCHRYSHRDPSETCGALQQNEGEPEEEADGPSCKQSDFQCKPDSGPRHQGMRWGQQEFTATPAGAFLEHVRSHVQLSPPRRQRPIPSTGPGWPEELHRL